MDENTMEYLNTQGIAIPKNSLELAFEKMEQKKTDYGVGYRMEGGEYSTRYYDTEENALGFIENLKKCSSCVYFEYLPDVCTYSDEKGEYIEIPVFSEEMNDDGGYDLIDIRREYVG